MMSNTSTKVITELTPEQWAKLPEFIDKWVKVASGKTDIQAANKAALEMYQRMGIKKPPLILHFTSPLLCHLAFSLLQGKGTGGALDSQLYSQLHSQLGSQLYSQLYSQLGSQLHSQLDSQLYSQLHSQLYSQLGSQLYSQLGSQLHSQLYSQLGSQLGSQLHSQLGSQPGSQYIVAWWLIWSGYYDFGKYINVQFDAELLRIFSDFTSNIHFCLPYENLFIYSHKPTQVRWRNRRLHNDSGMAVEYAEGWGWYCLNGVPMKPDYVLTPATEISPETVLKEKNVDMRRELLRKVGVIKMTQYSKEVDAMGDYKLIDMANLFTGIPYAPHLLMKNPSVDDTWHLEGVSPECKTVQEAINWSISGDKVKTWTPAELS